jgi:cellulose synthase/poly-beta-1,6-N-acetylglucosamine synthase-like glycosyltransferase
MTAQGRQLKLPSAPVAQVLRRLGVASGKPWRARDGARCAGCHFLIVPGWATCRHCGLPVGPVRRVERTGRASEPAALHKLRAQASALHFAMRSASWRTLSSYRAGRHRADQATSDLPSECLHEHSVGANFCRECGAPQPGSTWTRPIRLESRDLSAARTVTRRQLAATRVLLIAFLFLLGLNPLGALILLVAIATVLYLAVFAYRIRLFWGSLAAPAIVAVSDEEARSLPGDSLPIYSILVPAYREHEVISQLLDELDRIDYPKDRLDVKLMLEEDDADTIAATIRAQPRAYIDVIRVPDWPPKTKPKACNVGLAQARGEFVTIYDVEDRPEPLQLRRVVAAFRRGTPRVVCFQAKLSYYNADQNLLTRWFTGEYAMWFGQLLPGLVARGAPVPLGGTSNHFRREALVQLGGWDAFNVTEDADLGIRLYRAGQRTAVIESETLEEANSDFINWVKQRSRWYKGYLQTWLVHMRHPRRLWRELGPAGFLGFNLFVGGTPLLALINPVFWALTALWFLGHPAFVAALFPTWLYYAGLLCLTLGNFAFLYMTMASAAVTRRPSLVLAAIWSPLYWGMMSVAAVKALAQLLSAPSFWEKTAHGLDGSLARLGGSDVSG